MERTSFSRPFRCWLRYLGFFGTFILERKRGRIDHLHSQGHPTWRGYCDKFGYWSRPWSPCEHTIWATQPRCCQRPLRTRTYLEAITSQVASYSPALACISPWCGHCFWVISTSVIQKKDVLMFGTKTFTDGERLRCSILSFHTSLRLPSLITREETPQPLVSYALCQGLIVFFINLLVAEHESSIVILMSSRTWDSDHSEWPHSSTSCHSKANNSRTHEQTYSQLNVQTSRFLLPFATASRRPQVLSWPVLCTCRV